MNVDKIAKKILASFAEKEVERFFKDFLPSTKWKNHVWAVGGYVRDEVMGLDAKDLDIVMDIKGGPQELTKQLHQMFSKEITYPVNMGNYPIWQISFKEDIFWKGKIYRTAGAVIEFAESMKETFPDEKSRQRNVEFADLDSDVKRRDFTTNMMMKDLTNGEFVDLAGVSKEDIKKGILRGHPDVDFNEILRQDPLRMIRLVRFICKYNWTVPLSVLKTVKANASRIEIISEERIRDELIKIMKLGKLAKAIKFFDATGILKYIFPEIQTLKGVKQSPKHHQEGDVFKHSMMVLQNAPAGVENQLSALLHDAGKASTTQMIDGQIRSRGHEVVSGEIAEAVLRRLKFDADTIRKVRKIVESHMRPHQLHDSGSAAIRKFIREVGEELVDAVLELASADERGKKPSLNTVPELKKRVDDVRKYQAPTKNKAVLNGNEIMEILNIKPSAKIKEITDWLLDREDWYVENNKVYDKPTAMKEIIDKFK